MKHFALCVLLAVAGLQVNGARPLTFTTSNGFGTVLSKLNGNQLDLVTVSGGDGATNARNTYYQGAGTVALAVTDKQNKAIVDAGSLVTGPGRQSTGSAMAKVTAGNPSQIAATAGTTTSFLAGLTSSNSLSAAGISNNAAAGSTAGGTFVGVGSTATKSNTKVVPDLALTKSTAVSTGKDSTASTTATASAGSTNPTNPLGISAGVAFGVTTKTGDTAKSMSSAGAFNLNGGGVPITVSADPQLKNGQTVAVSGQVAVSNGKGVLVDVPFGNGGR
jgi:hypothetical protein